MTIKVSFSPMVTVRKSKAFRIVIFNLSLRKTNRVHV